LLFARVDEVELDFVPDFDAEPDFVLDVVDFADAGFVVDFVAAGALGAGAADSAASEARDDPLPDGRADVLRDVANAVNAFCAPSASTLGISPTRCAAKSLTCSTWF